MDLTDTGDTRRTHAVCDDEAAPSVADLHAEQTALVYTQAPVALGTALVVAFLMAVGLWGVVDQGLLMLWLGLHIVQTMTRAVVVWFYRRSTDSARRHPRWAQLYFAGTLVSGVIWGCIGLFISPDMPVTYQVLVAMGMAGVLAGAISSYAVLLPVYIAFMVPAMLITAQSMLLHASQSQHVMGVLFVVFAGR